MIQRLQDYELPPIEELMKDGGRLLVVYALRDMPYEEYLRTMHWSTVRRAALERSNWRCALCLSQVRLDVHHITYENLGDELPEDVVALCRKCHDQQHKSIKAVMAAHFNAIG